MIADTETAFCINTQTREEKEILFSEMDKYTAFSNRDYSLIIRYIRALESQLGQEKNKLYTHIRLELAKVRESKKTLDIKHNERSY